MNDNILAAIHSCRFSPIGALSNLAFYEARNLTLDDAAVIFDEWSASTCYPPDKRANCIDAIRKAIEEGQATKE